MGDASKASFTLRDEANAMTAYAFRSTFLEDLHAGEHAELFENPKYKRIADFEMKQLMTEASTIMEALLKMKKENREQYQEFIQACVILYTQGFEE
ncbi:MAG: hypothetical protein AB7V04_08235 [Desulfomonilaceae bacterium]